jgi:hypothetical protein
MKRALILGALLALGCDDESIPARVANAQLHGIVAAQIDCPTSCTFERVSNPMVTTSGYSYRAQRLLDGSCFVSGNVVAQFTFHGRSEAAAENCVAAYATQSLEAAGGLLLLSVGEGPSNQYQADIETCCTGFGLEAFGVE